MEPKIDLDRFIQRSINTNQVKDLFLVLAEYDDLTKKDFILKYSHYVLEQGYDFVEFIKTIEDPNIVLDIIRTSIITNNAMLREVVNTLKEKAKNIDIDNAEYYIDLRIKTKDKMDFRFFDIMDIKKKPSDIKKIFESDLLSPFFLIHLLDKISDEDLMEAYRLFDNDRSRYKMYTMTRNYKRQDLLLSVHPFETLIYKLLVHQNNIDESEIERIDIGKINTSLDPKITFGVELEAVTKNRTAQDLINRDKPYLFNGWGITEDCSISEIGEPNAGAEFVSPVLNYNSESLHNLKLICETLKEFEYYTNETCGGHIHLGFNYLKDAREVKTLINLYGVIEDFLYLASNKANSMLRRKSLDQFAKSNDVVIYNLSINFDKLKNMSDVVYYFNRKEKYSNERYYGLNLVNIGNENKNTIEFRMPNGEINYDELKTNIELFLSVFMLVKRICVDEETHKKYLELFTIDDQLERYERILELLFDSEEIREKYRDRIVSNNLENNYPEHYSVNLEECNYRR